MKFMRFLQATSTPPKIAIDENSITLNGQAMDFPITLEQLNAVLGPPSRTEHDPTWSVIRYHLWDDLGLYALHMISELTLCCLISDQHKLSHTPKCLFQGEITISGKAMAADFTGEIVFPEWTICTCIYEGFSKPYAICLGKTHPPEQPIPEDKYQIKPLNEPAIEFQDWGFKLAVIQELMYRQNVLTPQFDLYEFVRWYDKREIDIEEEGYDPIPEVMQYFRDLPIPLSMAPLISEIYQDGGNEIYSQLLRFAEGWEEYWDIETLADAHHFPNLKSAILCYAKPNIVDDFNALGIQARWL